MRIRSQQQGIALIITLILLAVITIMTVAFLKVSQRNRRLVATSLEQTEAQLMMETALERAKADIVSRLMSSPADTPRSQNLRAFTSTNFLSPEGFDLAAPFDPTDFSRLTNVEYYPASASLPLDVYGYRRPGAVPNNYREDNLEPTAPMPLGAQLQAIANLYFDPRVPVFVPTNRNLINDPFAPKEFRYYLDLNQNGKFDKTGIQGFVGLDGSLSSSNLYGSASNHYLGDPEWIGVLENPNYPHSGTNPFIGRYSFMVLPVGASLDANTIHNYARGVNPGSGAPLNMIENDYFLRNQGVGTWELNLAGLLAQLSTNIWHANDANPPLTYDYDPDPDSSVGNRGVAFDDALSFLRYRLRPEANVPLSLFNAQMSADDMISRGDLGPNATEILTGGAGDYYSAGPIDLDDIPDVYDNIDLEQPWSASPNPNRFYSIEEFLNENKVNNFNTDAPSTPGVTAVDRLHQASRNPTNYSEDRFAFYRLASLMSPEALLEPTSFPAGDFDDTDPRTNVYVPRAKMNLNYDNRQGVSTTEELLPWPDARSFFTNAADRMLRSQGFFNADGGLITLTNIQVWPVNEYGSHIHRVLQVAANLYEVNNTNPPPVDGPRYPTVFRPVFQRVETGTNSRIMICSFVEQRTNLTLSAAGLVSTNSFRNLNLEEERDEIPTDPDLTDFDSIGPDAIKLPYGVPLVIGVQKGYPNFNEFSINTGVQVQRSLLLERPTRNSGPSATNQYYFLGVSNVFGVEAWNSYTSDYPRQLELAVQLDIEVSVLNSNEEPVLAISSADSTTFNRISIARSYATNYTIDAFDWEGWISERTRAANFQVPLGVIADANFPSSLYIPGNGANGARFVDARTDDPELINDFINDTGWENDFANPDWILTMTNRLRYILIDKDHPDGDRIVDFVNIDNMDMNIDIRDLLESNDDDSGVADATGLDLWDSTRSDPNNPASPPFGVRTQIEIARKTLDVSPGVWESFFDSPGDEVTSRAEAFSDFMNPDYVTPPQKLVMQAPFTAVTTRVFERSFEVNDPLVHYTAQDLLDTRTLPDEGEDAGGEETRLDPPILGRVNPRYSPWGGSDDGQIFSVFDPSARDAGVTRSDDWVFPEGPLPTVGWMGRVHRGTPWQTIYMKSTSVDLETAGNWFEHAGNELTHPTRDWAFLDLFTAVPTTRAMQGRLSVNVDDPAGWAAVLSGVPVTEIVDPTTVATEYIAPATDAFNRMVVGIHARRNQRPGGLFSSAGEVFSAPELSLASPFFNNQAGAAPAGPGTNISARIPDSLAIDDVAVERIPQHIASLIRVTDPRVVVYAFGQALRPAPNSLVFDPDFYRLATNYQVVGEVAARAVIRFDNNSTNRVAGDYAPRPIVEDYKILPPE